MLVEESLSAQEIPYKITHYKDGVEALESLTNLASPPPDVIVLDLNMPRMSGLEVLSSLRQNQALSKVPIAVLTSSLAPEERQEAHRLGADRFLCKPVDLYEYLSEVGSMVVGLARDGV
jgi:CheY-like chemotaxis protein